MFNISDEVKDMVLGRGVHLGQLPAVLADVYGDRDAVEDPGLSPGLDHKEMRSYIDAEEATARFAAALRWAGVKKGDRLLLLIDNRIDLLWFTFAAARIGAVPVPVNDRLKPREIEGIVTATKAKRAVADPGVVERLTTGDEVADVDIDWISTADDGIAGWLKDNPGEMIEASPDDPESTAILLCTSGTTGVPKAAALSSAGLLSNVGRVVAIPAASGPRSGRDRMFAALPLPHVMGLGTALGAFCAGIPLIRQSRWSAKEALEVFETRKPNIFIGVPTMYADLESAGCAKRDLSSVQLWVSAADAMPPERARRFQKYGALAAPFGKGFGQAVFADIYGMVELSGAAAVRIFPPSLINAITMPALSAVLPGIECRVVGDDGQALSRGKVGALQFRGGGTLKEYEGRPDAGPTSDGWFETGDLARIWPGGLFQLAGRTKDRLKVGGFSVFPAEVEATIAEHPKVAEVAVVGLPDDRLGDRPAALVVATSEGLTSEEMLDWAGNHVAGYRKPHAVFIVDALPRGNNGKLDRVAATDLAVKLAGS